MNILFLCTGNSCRSQMAEAWAKEIYQDNKDLHFYSAGIETHGMNPWAIKVMKEQGIDLDSHFSKTLEDLENINFDLVITVCSHAHETCPVFSKGAKVIHHSFDDPPRLSKDLKKESEILEVYARVCDEIKKYIINLETQL